MEMKVQVPFQQLLALVRKLTPSQKAKLREELTVVEPAQSEDAGFMDFLLHGPVFSKSQIDVIKENRKSIAAWRTKD